MNADALPRVLLLMRVALHVLFAFLLTFAFLRASSTSQSPENQIVITVLVLALAVFYVWGTAWESRFTRGATLRNPRPYAVVWLGIVCCLWAVLVFLADDFVWLLFPLIFLVLAVTPLTLGLVVVVALLAYTVRVSAWRFPENFGMGSMMGPAIGTTVALGLYLVYRVLHSEAVRYRQVAQELSATRDELARHEHESGRLHERQRMAREIHDTLAQGFSSILLASRAAKRNLRDTDLEKTLNQLDLIGMVAQDNLKNSRELVASQDQPVAGELDVVPELERILTSARAHAKALDKGTEFHLRIHHTDIEADASTPVLIPEILATALIRACQEAITNVLKHSKATTSVITLGAWEREMTLDIFDNGKGLNPNAPTDRFGLRSIRERIAELGGYVTVESAPALEGGNGTVVAIRIPMRPTLRQERSAQK